MNDQEYHVPHLPLSDMEMQPIATAPLQPDAPTLPPGDSPPNTTHPPGLEYLTDLDYIFVNQKKNHCFQGFLNSVFGWEPKKKYVIMNNKSEPVFYVAEKSKICWRLCLSQERSCKFTVSDKDRQEVFYMRRPFNWGGGCICCCLCCQEVLRVYSGTTLLGSVTLEHCLGTKFYVRDESGQPVLMIKKSFIDFCTDKVFKIKSLDETHHVGTIRKNYTGFDPEMFTYMIGIKFSRDLDVKLKAVLLGASILIITVILSSRSSTLGAVKYMNGCGHPSKYFTASNVLNLEDRMIKSLDGNHLGTIQKYDTGFDSKMFTYSVGIEFSRDLDVKLKAVLLGAGILMDFMYLHKGIINFSELFDLFS